LWYLITHLTRLGDGRLYPGEEIGGGDAKGRSNIHEFNDIDPPFAILILGNERLRLVQRFSQLSLRQSFGLARFDKQRLQKYLSGRAQGLLHSRGLSIERGEPLR